MERDEHKLRAMKSKINEVQDNTINSPQKITAPKN
jgi:uncharacterized coiled-coil protein SlyX